MATFSEAARNAAIDAIAALLEDGVTFARPALLSLDAGAGTVHFTFFANTAPVEATFNAASGGVATKFTLPWNMTVSTTTLRTLATWQLRSQANVTEISGTWGAAGSGADMEMDTADNLTVLQGNRIQVTSFSLEMT
jgi:hypothetical protein